MPVVFAAVTGYASAEDQQRALAAGFDSFLVKPLKPGSLANLLRSYRRQPGRLRRRRARAQRTSSSAPGSLIGSPSSAGVFLQPVVERLQADAERGRGLLLVAAEVLERGQRQLPLDLGERRADPDR